MCSADDTNKNLFYSSWQCHCWRSVYLVWINTGLSEISRHSQSNVQESNFNWTQFMDWVLLTMSGFFQNTVWHIHDRVQFLIIFLVSLNLVVRPDMVVKSGWFLNYFVVNNYKIFERHSFYKRYLSRNQSADIPLTP